MWSYRCLPAVMTCALYGDEVPVSVLLSRAVTAEVPDVILVEAWLRGHLKTPTTVERLAVDVSDRWRACATVEGEAPRHGVITATALA